MPAGAVCRRRLARRTGRRPWDASLHASLGPAQAAVAVGQTWAIVSRMARGERHRVGSGLAACTSMALAEDRTSAATHGPRHYGRACTGARLWAAEEAPWQPALGRTGGPIPAPSGRHSGASRRARRFEFEARRQLCWCRLRQPERSALAAAGGGAPQVAPGAPGAAGRRGTAWWRRSGPSSRKAWRWSRCRRYQQESPWTPSLWIFLVPASIWGLELVRKPPKPSPPPPRTSTRSSPQKRR